MLNIKPHVKGGTLLMDVRITRVDHVSTSSAGNPSYKLTTSDGTFRTMIDAADNWGAENYAAASAPLVCLELTRHGRVRQITPMPLVASVYAPKES